MSLDFIIDDRGALELYPEPANMDSRTDSLSMDVKSIFAVLTRDDAPDATTRAMLLQADHLSCKIQASEERFKAVRHLLEPMIVSAAHLAAEWARFSSAGISLRFRLRLRKDSVKNKKVTKKTQQSSLKDRFPAGIDPAGAAAAMVKDKTPGFSRDDIRDIKHIIRAAQDDPPKDKQAFVDNINRLLELSQYRIQLPDGTLTRLIINPGRDGTGFIQFKGSGGSRGFKNNTSFKLRRVPEGYKSHGLTPS